MRGIITLGLRNENDNFLKVSQTFQEYANDIKYLIEAENKQIKKIVDRIEKSVSALQSSKKLLKKYQKEQ